MALTPEKPRDRADVPAAVRQRLSLLTADQVCELLQVTKPWLYDVVQAGRFPHVRLGRQLRFRPSEIEAYLDGTWQPQRNGHDPRPPRAR
jgi:excisionase family DNA binding protein